MKNESVAILLALTLLVFGCAGQAPGNGNASPAGGTDSGIQGPSDAREGSASGAADAEVADGAATDMQGPEQDTAPDSQATGFAGGKTRVLMLGRSVAYGWAEYMGLQWQEDESYLGDYDGRSFRYLHMDYPPDIDDSAIRAMGTYDFDIVFFKLCFVDFGSEYGDMLQEDEQYVENVYQEAVVRRGKKLIVGNALPQVSRDTTPGLKQNHKAYNDWLDGFASSHRGVYVMDLHGSLADSGGALKSEYASSYDDSHPNNAGYARMTPEFMSVISKAEAG